MKKENIYVKETSKKLNKTSLQLKIKRGVILRKKQYKESLETKDKKIIEQQKKEALVKAGEKSILEEFKNNLPEYLECRLQALTQEIEAREEVKGLNSIEINELLRPHNLIGQPAKYTAEQLQIIFDYYREALVKINRKVKYPPSKENFCAFAGMSTATYNQYLISSDEDKQEIMLMIDDYIRENMLTSAQLRDIDNVTTMFRGKTAHGMVEAVAPIVVKHHSETDMSKINAMIEQLKQGKSLKTIELDKKDYNVEGE